MSARTGIIRIGNKGRKQIFIFEACFGRFFTLKNAFIFCFEKAALSSLILLLRFYITFYWFDISNGVSFIRKTTKI